MIILVTLTALAEGEMANGAILFQDTELYVDILEETEWFYWTGDGPVDVYQPDGTHQGDYTDKQRIVPEAGVGAYKLVMSLDQADYWLVVVNDASNNKQAGRLHSYRYHFDTTDTDAGQWGIFYVAVPLGSSDNRGIIEARISGAIGEDFTFLATATGLAHAPAQSAPQDEGDAVGQHPIYFNAPELGTWISPTATDAGFEAEGELCPDAITPGRLGGAFTASAGQDGVLQVVCDTNSDSDFDRSGATDTLLLSEVSAGAVSVSWDGISTDGSAVEAGSLACVVELLVGGAHLLIGDTDTCYEGVRLFAWEAKADAVERPMFWNDAAVQSGGAQLPYNSKISPSTPGPEGMLSGDPDSFDWVNVNSRAWGSYTKTSKGSQSWMDTWIWSDRVEAGEVVLEVIDQGADTDKDTLYDAEERCQLGTDPELEDTDGDGLSDPTEVGNIDNPTDTDGDLTIDALDSDDDDDGLLTGIEVEDGAQFGEDVDEDGAANWHDTDADDDGIPDGDEPGDDNSNGVPDYLEPPDTGTPSPEESASVGGTFQGGACACASSSPPGVAMLALLIVVRRRRLTPTHLR